MKALSGRQPWWWAIMHAGKRIENRSWNTRYRGPILLHAAKGCTNYELEVDLCWMLERKLIRYEQWPGLDRVERGGIVGRARIVDVIPKMWPPHDGFQTARRHGADPRWWMQDQYGFVLADVEALPFRAWPGALGLFDVPASALQTEES